ncbi:MAG: hypothetical protein ACYTXF_36890 [Nostoc sp.]
MARKGRVKLSNQEIQDRKNYILTRLRSGFPRLDVQRQFAEHFKCTTETARGWLNKTCDELVDTDISQRKRDRAVILEMYHAQITAYQNEIMAMQREIDKISEFETIRKLTFAQMENAAGAELLELKQRIKSIPEPRLTDKAFLIDTKSRIRERMFRVISELNRMQGSKDAATEWRDALVTLLDRNLLPGSTADRILQIIDSHETELNNKIHQI